MRKILLTSLLTLLFLFLLIPANTPTKHELHIKNSILQKDVDQTKTLCNMHCTQEFQQLIAEQQHSSSFDKVLSMQSLQQSHPHIVQMHWLKSGQTLEEGLSIGEVSDELYHLSLPFLNQAISELQLAPVYQSPTFHYRQNPYLVLGTVADQSDDLIIGLIDEGILNHVSIAQRKNLRIVPYPSEKRFNIQSADPDTLQDVHVDHPEQNEGMSHYHEYQVVVRFQQEPTEEQFRQIETEIGASRIQKLGYTYVFQSNSMDTKKLMNYFQKWNVQYVEPHFLYMTNEPEESEWIPNDVLFRPYQWNLPLIDTLKGWELSRGSEDVIVAVIDTGVDLTHHDLEGQLVEGINVIDEPLPPIDDVGHGTHVAGVISAIVNNVEGIAGMSWYNKIMPIKSLDHTGAGSTYSVAQGIIWATDHGAKVINLSLGNYADAEFLHDAIRYAFDHDVVLVAATGNDNTEQSGYPAAYPEVLAVSAINAHRNKAYFSNYGSYVDVVAPGENIASTYLHNQYAALSGTSMASPHVAALAAMIRSINPLLKNTEVMDIIRNTAIDLGEKGKDKYYGYGLIHVSAALEQAAETRTSLFLWPRLLERQLRQIGNE